MNPTTSTNLPAARVWAQSASSTQIARAHRLLRVATPSSDPLVVLRVLFGAPRGEPLGRLVATCFDRTPTLTCVQAFLREVATVRPHEAERRGPA